MVGYRLVQGMGAPRAPRQLNAKADVGMAVVLPGQVICGQGQGVN